MKPEPTGNEHARFSGRGTNRIFPSLGKDDPAHAGCHGKKVAAGVSRL